MCGSTPFLRMEVIRKQSWVTLSFPRRDTSGNRKMSSRFLPDARGLRWPRFLDHWLVKISDGWQGLVVCYRGQSFPFNLLFGLVSDFYLRSAGPGWPQSVAQRPARARSKGDKNRKRAVVGVVFWLFFMRPPSSLCDLPGRLSPGFDFPALGVCAMRCSV